MQAATSTQQQDHGQVDIRRTYAASPDKLWQAWTDPQALSQWFGPGQLPSNARAEIDLRVGGAYRVAFQAPNGETHEASGVYQEVVPNRRLVFTWGWKGTPERVSRITIDLQPVADGTELHFVHDRFFDATARSNHERGWQAFFGNLDTFMRGQEA